MCVVAAGVSRFDTATSSSRTRILRIDGYSGVRSTPVAVLPRAGPCGLVTLLVDAFLLPCASRDLGGHVGTGGVSAGSSGS